MAHHVVVTVDNIGTLTNALDDIQLELEQKLDTLVNRLAEIGAEQANDGFSGAEYDGNGGASARPVTGNGNTSTVLAEGDAVLFIEFGAGNLKGWGHPEPMGYGPGTYNPNYPTKENPNWSNPNGWYYAHGQKSYGNPPTAAMYNARKYLEQNLAAIAGEIFG